MNDIVLGLESRRRLVECGYTITKEGFYHPDRIMHDFDLLYMISGTWQINVGGELLDLAAGDMVLLPPGVRHYGTTLCSLDMRNMYIHFAPADGDGIEGAECMTGEGGGRAVVEGMADESDGRARAEQVTIPLMVKLGDNFDIPEQFREIINIFYSCKSVNRELLLSTRLEVLLLSLAEFAGNERRSEKMPPEIAEIIRLFTENPERFYSQTELAERFGISVRSLTSRFKQATGTTLHAWQTDYKLGVIHDILLSSPGRKLRDLAVSYGFYDEFQLSRLFKKKYGSSPRRIGTRYKYNF